MKENKKGLENVESEEPKNKISRRDFLKYSVGVAAVAAGATAMMGKIPLPADPLKTSPPNNQGSEPIVVTVEGENLTVMSGHNEVKVKDSGLADAIASKIQ